MREKDRNAVAYKFVKGDITDQHADAVVNAANNSLLGGGGVDGAIHRRGGPAILEACRQLRTGTLRDGLPTGDAVATTAGELHAKHVIHTVGPVWGGGARGEDGLLASAYASSLRTAAAVGAQTIAFPSISTGAYGFPTERAARVALKAIRDAVARGDAPGVREVRFVLFSNEDYEIYKQAYEEIMRG